MVLGIRSRNKKGDSSSSSLELDYQINVVEIKPWPLKPSSSGNSTESLFLQWQNGEQNYGTLTSSFIGDGRVEFVSDPFRLLLTLSRKKGTFQKNLLEFYLYEPKKDKGSNKAQLLGSAVINLSDYGDLQESVLIGEPINLKKSFKGSSQPVVYVNVQPLGRNSDSVGSESASTLRNEGDDVESESLLSITDEEVEEEDAVSSHSSRTVSSSSALENAGGGFDNDKNVSESLKDGIETLKRGPSSLVMAPPIAEVKILAEPFQPPKTSSSSLPSTGLNAREEVSGSESDISILSGEDMEQQQRLGQYEGKKPVSEGKFVHKLPQHDMKKGINLRSQSLAYGRSSQGVQGRAAASHKLKHLMSVSGQSNFGSSQGTRPSTNSPSVEKKQTDAPEDTPISVQSNFNSSTGNGSSSNSNNGIQKEKENDTRKNIQNSATSCELERQGTDHDFSDERVKLESQIWILEEELRETAAVEVGLYSIVAEHTSSTSKVHAPARRLSRFYLHAFKSRSPARRATAARAAVSGLVLVSKACGTDVPRLTFWLSNSIGLRAITSQAIKKSQLSTKPHGGNDDWEDPQTFLFALEKYEAWVFSRIVESVWWQALTPHMQPAAAKSSGSRKGHTRRYGLGDQDQGTFSVELWKKAFKDSCERLCPLRAAGHECGCLPVMAKLVMEQLVSRLDVAMFNAILRESAEEMPTDPVSDPISDSKVLPIPAGRSSFGAGAQLKNAVGSWSRWLTDLFDIDDNDSPEDNLDDGNRVGSHTSFKAFPLLKALSDLMMLPLEMLADSSTRKEVCPAFGTTVVKRVLENFIPDEFNPEPIPEEVFHYLEEEDLYEVNGEQFITTIPCIATPTVYSPPLAASLLSVIGEASSQSLQKSPSAVLRKSYTSDDELEELDSPINLIFTDNSRISPNSASSNWVPKGNGRKVARYQLLREVWKEGE